MWTVLHELTSNTLKNNQNSFCYSTLTPLYQISELRLSLSLCIYQVQLTVLDVNDFRPRFSERVFTTSVFENEPVGTSVITMKAIDLDEGENALLTYSLQGPGAGKSHTHTHTHRYTENIDTWVANLGLKNWLLEF